MTKNFSGMIPSNLSHGKFKLQSKSQYQVVSLVSRVNAHHTIFYVNCTTIFDKNNIIT